MIISAFSSRSDVFEDISTLELAQILAERLAISPLDWHRLKSDRNARSAEQLGAALVFLLKDNPKEALPRIKQAEGWLDRTLSAPPCEGH